MSVKELKCNINDIAQERWITSLKIPGEMLAMKCRFFSFRLAPQILSRGCETKTWDWHKFHTLVLFKYEIWFLKSTLKFKESKHMCAGTLATSTQKIQEPFSRQNSSNIATWYF